MRCKTLVICVEFKMVNNFSYKRKLGFKKICMSQSKHYGWALRVLKGGSISAKQIDNLNQYINKKIKSLSKNIKIRFLKNAVLSKKPIETRMGGGKSSIIEYRYQPSSGFILFEIYGVEFEIIYYLTKYIKNKLSCVVQLIRLDE